MPLIFIGLLLTVMGTITWPWREHFNTGNITAAFQWLDR